MQQNGSIRLAIADAHPVFRMGMHRVFDAEHEIEIVAEAADGEQAIAAVREKQPDLLLCEFNLPKLNGLQVLESVKTSYVNTQVVFVTSGMPRNELLAALRGGLRGMILKDVEAKVFAKAVRCVHKGEVWVERDILTEWASTNSTPSSNYNLTVRELGIIREILSGKSNKEIASNLALTEDTVKRHLTNVFRKLKVSSRLELSLFAMHRRLIS